MFKSFNFYAKKKTDIDQACRALSGLGYVRVGDALEAGDFSVKGDMLEFFPVNFSFPVRVEWDFDVVDKIYSFDKTLGKKIMDYDFLIVIPFSRKAAKSISKYSENLPLEIVISLKKGDYVVHNTYGIGRFLGTKELIVKGVRGRFFQIEYARGDHIYVPAEQAHLVQKYSNFTSKAPKLSTLGTGEWSRIKEKVRHGIRKYALELLRMEAQRRVIGGFKSLPDDRWQKMFEKKFPYIETADQIKATAQVKKDMESGRCMDRLICGDTGYGKTEVAMRAAFKMVMSSRQVAFLVPTTVLAYQHYQNLIKRLEGFPVEVEMMSRFRTAARQKVISERVRSGKIDILVGTHRILSPDIEFKNMGLLIVDEEQKFGVAAKEKLKSLKVGIDVLSLTATPIPRTLYMGLAGIKDLSLIKTPPRQRLAIKTEVRDFSIKALKDNIMREVNRGGQVFLVNNRIKGLAALEKILLRDMPGNVSLGVVHGQMPPAYIEKVMLDFIEGRINCLVSTAIVESGIDIPPANTIIVNDAHIFGLSDLHQLRGRVGRSTVQAYACFLVPKLSSLPEESREKLRLLEEFSHLGAGFEIAMRDLELRGAGNLLGLQQHGFIWMVGFDLYCRLLKKEIEYLRSSFNLN